MICSVFFFFVVAGNGWILLGKQVEGGARCAEKIGIHMYKIVAHQTNHKYHIAPYLDAAVVRRDISIHPSDVVQLRQNSPNSAKASIVFNSIILYFIPFTVINSTSN